MTSLSAEQISETAKRLLEEFHLPGLSVGVVSGNELVYAEGFGWADISRRRPQDPILHQRIGSITKTMVCLCALALVDEQRLRLDARVAELLPDLKFNGYGDELTLWHLLTHTGGIGEAPTSADVADPIRVLWADGPETPPLAEKYPDGITIDVRPGSKWHYANHGWMLVGEIIARLEGATIEQVLHRRVFNPLGMHTTDNLDLPGERLTTGYLHAPSPEALDQLELLGKAPPSRGPIDGHNIPGDWVYINGRAAGAVQSNIPDMALYAAALLNSGGGIVSPETFKEMLKPHWCPDERLISIGLAFFRSQQFSEFTFGHNGGVDGGWNTNLTVIPGRNLAMLVHLNAYLDTSEDVYSQLLQVILDAPTPPLPGTPLDATVRSSATGVYTFPSGTLTNSRPIRLHGRLQITEEDGELILRSRRGAWRNGIRLLPVDADDPFFLALDTASVVKPKIALILDSGGQVSGLRLDRLTLMERDDTLSPWA
jgi:CubicO group peptidase (beta-lactamase class C family)